MTIDDAKQALEQLKNNGYSEEDIVKTLYLMYADGKMSLSDLRSLTELIGYEFTEEFEKMPEEDKKTKGLEINYEFFDKASLPEAAETFASMMNIPVDIAKGFLNDGLQEGRTYCETVKKYRAGDIISFDEAKAEVKKLEASGMSKQDISDKAFELFKNDEISLSDLRVFFAVCGFEFTPEFEALSLEDKKKDGCVIDSKEEPSIDIGDAQPSSNDIPIISKTICNYSAQDVQELKGKKLSLNDAARMMAERYGKTVNDSRRILRECNDRGMSYAEAIVSGATLSNGMTMHEAAQKITWIIGCNDTKFIKRMLKMFLQQGKSYAYAITFFDSPINDASLEDITCVFACENNMAYKEAFSYLKSNRKGNEPYTSVIARLNEEKRQLPISELEQIIEQEKKAYSKDNEILKDLYNKYCNNNIRLVDLEDLAELLGYQLSKEFRELPLNKNKSINDIDRVFSTISLDKVARLISRSYNGLCIKETKMLLEANLYDHISYKQTLEKYMEGKGLNQRMVFALIREHNGQKNEDVCFGFYQNYLSNKYTLGEFRILAYYLGYEFKDEFLNTTARERKDSIYTVKSLIEDCLINDRPTYLFTL